MISRFIAATVVVPSIILNGNASTLQNQAALKHIDRAAELLFVPENSARIQEGVASLLDAVAELTAHVDAPANVRTSVQAARQELARGGPMVDANVGGLLREAYQALHPGKTFQARVPSGDMSEVLSELKRRLDAGRSLLAAGKTDESVRVLLDVALTIVTPVQQ